MPFKYEINGKIFEFDKEPTESDIDEVASQSGTEQPQEDIFTPAQLSMPPDDSQLSFMQNYMLGSIKDNNAKARYLKNVLGGKQVGMNEQGEVVADGVPVNAKGLASALPYTFDVAGQIAGGLMGAGFGTAGGPPGMVAGTVGGGLTGATIGAGIRMAVTDMLGFDQNEQEVMADIEDSVKSAALGEAIGLGVAPAGSFLAKGISKMGIDKYLSGVGGSISKTLKKAFPGMTDDAIHFLTGQDYDTVARTRAKGPSTVITKESLDPNAVNKIANDVFFDSPNKDTLDLDLVEKATGLPSGVKLLLQSVKNTDHQAYDELVKGFANIDSDSLKVIRENNLDAILNKENITPERAKQISENIIKSIKDQRDMLGKEYELAIKKSPIVGYEVDSFTSKLGGFLKKNNLYQKVTPDGFVKEEYENALGDKNLEDLINLFKGTVVRKNPKTGKMEQVKDFLEGVLTKGQVFRLNNQVSNIADKIFEGNSTSQVKIVAKDILDKWREGIASHFKVTKEKEAFKQFANLVDGIRINGDNARIGLENFIKGFKRSTATKQDILFNALKGLPGNKGSKILKDIELHNLGRVLSGIKPSEVSKLFGKAINRKEIFAQDVARSSIDDLLKNIDSSLSNSQFKNKAFLDKAENSILAKNWLGGGPNILRLQSVIAMTGLGSVLGFMKMGGVAGGMASGLLTAALATRLTNPRNFSKFLVHLDKNPGLAKKFASLAKSRMTVSQKDQDKTKALLRALLSRQISSERQKNK